MNVTVIQDEMVEAVRREAPTAVDIIEAARSEHGIHLAAAVALRELAALADRRTMGRAEVAEFLGARGTNLRYQHGLPEPFARHRSGPVWWVREVEAYKAKRDGENS